MNNNKLFFADLSTSSKTSVYKIFNFFVRGTSASSQVKDFDLRNRENEKQRTPKINIWFLILDGYRFV